MTDITTQDLLEVARGVYPQYEFDIVRNSVWMNVSNSQPYWIEFDPLSSDADAFKVLESLVNLEGVTHQLGVSPYGEYWCEVITHSECGMSYSSKIFEKCKDLRTAIVKAYLSLVEAV